MNKLFGSNDRIACHTMFIGKQWVCLVSGVEFFVSDEPHAYAIIHFESGSVLAAFLTDAEAAEFRKKDNNEWARNSDYPYDCIQKIDETTLECHSVYPF